MKGHFLNWSHMSQNEGQSMVFNLYIAKDSLVVTTD